MTETWWVLAAPYPALQGAISVHPGHLQQAQKRSKCGRFGVCEGVRGCVHVCVAVGLTWCFGGSSTSTCGHVQVVHTPGDEPRHPATVTGPGRWQHTAAERREWCKYSPTKVQTSTTSLLSTGRLLLDQGDSRLPSGGFRRGTRCSRSRTPEVPEISPRLVPGTRRASAQLRPSRMHTLSVQTHEERLKHAYSPLAGAQRLSGRPQPAQGTQRSVVARDSRAVT